jgi:hypothetical protein
MSGRKHLQQNVRGLAWDTYDLPLLLKVNFLQAELRKWVRKDHMAQTPQTLVINTEIQYIANQFIICP